jgi:hypothetical protein
MKKDGYVYLIGSVDDKKRFKIGVTRGDVEKRLKKLQTGNPEQLYVRHKYKTSSPFKLEKMLHTVYHNSNELNEWFTVENDDINNFIETCDKYQKIIDSLDGNPFFNKN